jgi:transposase InsO family protein
MGRTGRGAAKNIGVLAREKLHSKIGEVEAGVRQWIERDNTRRPHQTLGNRTPARVYEVARKPATLAEMKSLPVNVFTMADGHHQHE